MTHMYRTISTLLFVTAVVAAAEQSERVVPQPRVRLHVTPQGMVARVEKIESAPVPIMLEKVVVAESRLPQSRPDEVPVDPKQFSASGGGTLFSGKVGDAPYAVGLWPRYDLFWKDSQFKPQRTRVDIEFVRVKL